MIDKLPSYIIIKKIFLIILIPAIFVFIIMYYQNIKAQRNAIVAQIAMRNAGVSSSLNFLLLAGFSIEEICEYLYTNGDLHKHSEKAQKKLEEDRKKN